MSVNLVELTFGDLSCASQAILDSVSDVYSLFKAIGHQSVSNSVLLMIDSTSSISQKRFINRLSISVNLNREILVYCLNIWQFKSILVCFLLV